MAVSLEHLGSGRAETVVVHGVDSPQAVAHLCESLERGGGPTAPLIVLDLTGAPLTGQASDSAIHHAAEALIRSHRWLGVVEPEHAQATHHRDGWYPTILAALAAGHHYADLMQGRRPFDERLETVGAAIVGAVTWVPELVTLAATQLRDAAVFTIRVAARRLH